MRLLEFIKKRNRKDIMLAFVLFLFLAIIYIFPFIIKAGYRTRAFLTVASSGVVEKKVGLTVFKKEKTYPGDVLVGALNHHLEKGSLVEKHTYLINENGDVINSWDLEGFPAKLLQNGNILGSKYYFIENSDGIHQEAKKIEELDWSGKRVWSFDNWEVGLSNENIARSHHGLERKNTSTIYTPKENSYSISSEITLILTDRKSVV